MTYVVGGACFGTTDRSCVDVCPVDCIHDVGEMLVIDPCECIDCAACEAACPVQAISPLDGVPLSEMPFVAINAAWSEGPDEVKRLLTEQLDVTTLR